MTLTTTYFPTSPASKTNQDQIVSWSITLHVKSGSSEILHLPMCTQDPGSYTVYTRVKKKKKEKKTETSCYYFNIVSMRKTTNAENEKMWKKN